MRLQERPVPLPEGLMLLADGLVRWYGPLRVPRVLPARRPVLLACGPVPPTHSAA